MQIEAEKLRLSRPQAWFLVYVMFMAWLVGQIDRQILAMLVEEMKRDLSFTDEQVGLLMGFGFSLSYSVGAFVMAHLGDRMGRKAILGIGLLVWSMLTSLCAFASNFPTLFAARLGVGLGESALSPTSLPMVTEAFRPEQRSLPIAFCLAGTSVGLVVTPMLIGYLVDRIGSGKRQLLPFFEPIFGWQIAFIFCGGLGLLVFALLIFVKEPGRSVKEAKTASFLDAAGFFYHNTRFCCALFFATPLLVSTNYSLIGWMPAYLSREFNLGFREIGTLIGLAFVPAAVISPFIASYLSSAIVQPRSGQTHFRVMLILVPVVGMILLSPMLMPTANSAAVALSCAVTAATVAITFSLTQVQQLISTELRSQATALAMGSFLLIGSGFGPALSGIFATRLVGEDSIGLAMILSTGVSVPISALLLIFALRGEGIRTLHS